MAVTRDRSGTASGSGETGQRHKSEISMDAGLDAPGPTQPESSKGSGSMKQMRKAPSHRNTVASEKKLSCGAALHRVRA